MRSPAKPRRRPAGRSTRRRFNMHRGRSRPGSRSPPLHKTRLQHAKREEASTKMWVLSDGGRISTQAFKARPGALASWRGTTRTYPLWLPQNLHELARLPSHHPSCCRQSESRFDCTLLDQYYSVLKVCSLYTCPDLQLH